MSSTEDVYQALRRAIQAQEFMPGERLKETALASRFGISRTPLREAFNRLASEGWLEHVPNQGVRVITWTIADIQNVFAVRLQLEPYATAKATLALDVTQITLLEQHAEDVRRFAAQPGEDAVAERTRANGQFHGLLLQAAGNARLTAMLASLVELPMVAWTFRAFSPEDTQRSVTQHFEIVQAVRARDPAWAEAVMKTHILAAQHAVVHRLTQTPAAAASQVSGLFS